LVNTLKESLHLEPSRSLIPRDKRKWAISKVMRVIVEAMTRGKEEMDFLKRENWIFLELYDPKSNLFYGDKNNRDIREFKTYSISDSILEEADLKNLIAGMINKQTMRQLARGTPLEEGEEAKICKAFRVHSYLTDSTMKIPINIEEFGEDWSLILNNPKSSNQLVESILRFMFNYKIERFHVDKKDFLALITQRDYSSSVHAALWRLLHSNKIPSLTATDLNDIEAQMIDRFLSSSKYAERLHFSDIVRRLLEDPQKIEKFLKKTAFEPIQVENCEGGAKSLKELCGLLVLQHATNLLENIRDSLPSELGVGYTILFNYIDDTYMYIF
jgi:hypothetical protein